jgi:hypothetical protein
MPAPPIQGWFFPWWWPIVVRSHTYGPGFRGISSVASLGPVFHGPCPAPLSLPIDSLATTGKTTVDDKGEKP